MAEPKKKLSKSRTHSRRHQIKLDSVNIVYCNECHEPKLHHQVCSNCGTYRGKKVINVEEKVAEPVSETEK